MIVYGTVARWMEYFPVNTKRQAELSGKPAEQIKKEVHDQQTVLHALLIEKKSFNEVLRHFNIVFNYVEKEVLLTKNRFFSEPYRFTPPPGYENPANEEIPIIKR
ncbi:MAG: hypothetical protein AB9903_24415 [Vulcanimicrobiota bacterium]